MNSNTMDKITALAKRRGFIYPGSDIYGGLANTYDYGPLGAELLRNIRNLWWEYFIEKREGMVGIDSSLISHHKVWEASGHVASFADALVDCKNCKLRKRADHLIEEWLENQDSENLIAKNIRMKTLSEKSLNYHLRNKKVEGLTVKQLNEFIQSFAITCPNCGKHEWTSVRKFNQLFPVKLGLIEGEEGHAYLRGETAQGIFINFRNIMDSNRVKLPFGVGQIGKSFRNEITPGNSVFRTIEFEQGEIEYFFDPEATSWEEKFELWKSSMWEFVTKRMKIQERNLKWRTHTDEERSFYSKRTEDLEYNYPFGFKELWGIAYRTDYDLKQHSKFSGKDLQVVDSSSGRKYIPHVIEPAVGINRLFLMSLCDGYTEEGERIIMKLSPKLAPVKAAVFPLVANKPELVNMARVIYEDFKQNIAGLIQWDDRGNIGKRYLNQDEIGTPFCITIDYQSLEDKTVTVRERDSATQERIRIEKLIPSFRDKLA